MGNRGIEQFRIAAKATIQATQLELVRVAKQEHARIMAASPRPTRFTRVVDGILNAKEEAVKADGVIHYSYGRLDEVVQFALDTLFDLSPVLSGAYRDNHTLFVNGSEARNLADYTGGDVFITNDLPYARKIEVGHMRMTMPETDHVYLQAQIIVSKRFGNMATIRFAYRGIVGGFAPDPSQSAPSLRRRHKGKFVAGGGHAYNKSEVRFPSLEIEAR